MGLDSEYTLYAVWQAIEYTITYNLNNGQNNISNPTKFTVEDLPVDLYNPTKENYVFNDWYISSQYSEPIYQITECGNITLYAEFIQYTKGLEFTLSSDGTYYNVSDYTGDSEKVVFIEKYNNKPIKGIDASAFEDCTYITSITIPDSVTSIGECAFYNCSSLTSIELPDSVTNIGDSAFDGCSNLRSIVIPNSVTSIGDYAFYDCSSLTSIIIPDSVTSIGDYAFYNCTSLTSITIPEEVASIGDYAFYNCSSLTSIIIPDSVTSIGDYAFYDCSSLTSVTFDNPNNWQISKFRDFLSYTSLSNSSLSNASTATDYLKYNYVSYYWRRVA